MKLTWSPHPSRLCIYRWANQTMATAMDHPMLPLIWQRFFRLYLERPASQPGYQYIYCSSQASYDSYSFSIFYHLFHLFNLTSYILLSLLDRIFHVHILGVASQQEQKTKASKMIQYPLIQRAQYDLQHQEKSLLHLMDYLCSVSSPERAGVGYRYFDSQADVSLLKRMKQRLQTTSEHHRCKVTEMNTDQDSVGEGGDDEINKQFEETKAFHDRLAS